VEGRAEVSDIYGDRADFRKRQPGDPGKAPRRSRIIVHGDPTVPVAGSRTMVAKLKELGIDHSASKSPVDCTATWSVRTWRRS
jgi:hypothetical protein